MLLFALVHVYSTVFLISVLICGKSAFLTFLIWETLNKTEDELLGGSEGSGRSRENGYISPLPYICINQPLFIYTLGGSVCVCVCI